MCFVINKEYVKKFEKQKNRPKVHTFYKAFNAYICNNKLTLITPYQYMKIKKPGKVTAEGDLVFTDGIIEGGCLHAYSNLKSAKNNYSLSEIIKIKVKDKDIISINSHEVCCFKYTISKTEWDKRLKKEKRYYGL